MSDAARKQVYQQSSDAPDWAALAADAWEAPSWKAAAQEFCDTRQRRGGKPPQPPDPQFLALLDPAISLVEEAQRRLLEPRLGGAVASTVEALVYSLRRGADALADPDAVRRLAELSDNQLLEVGERLRKLKSKIARAWSADEVATLIQFRERLK